MSVEDIIDEFGQKVTIVKVQQDNGWTRIDSYYPDGTITEEYEKTKDIEESK